MESSGDGLGARAELLRAPDIVAAIDGSNRLPTDF